MITNGLVTAGAQEATPANEEPPAMAAPAKADAARAHAATGGKGRPADEYHEHDTAYAERFVAAYGDRILYDHTHKQWYIYDGVRWAADSTGKIREMAKECARRALDQAITGKKNPETLRRAEAALNAPSLTHMLQCASTIPSIAVKSSVWNADPLLFNVPNGTLDLRTGDVRKHDPADRITMVAGCEYDEKAEAPAMRQCLEDYFPAHQARYAGVRAYLEQLLGYCLSGLVDEKAFVLLEGPGDTGKTTFMHAIEAVWGEYFRTADWSSFVQQREADGSRHRTDLVRLEGARIVSASEGERKWRMSNALLKAIAGRVPLVLREMHTKAYEQRVTYKLWLDSNFKPPFEDAATLARLRHFHFANVISRDQRLAMRRRYGKHLDDVLASEASGILNIAFAGWRAYQNAGELLVPAAYGMPKGSGAVVRSERLVQFIADCCIIGEPHEVEKRVLYARFVEFCKKCSEQPVAQRQFSIWLGRLGYEDRPGNRDRIWINIAIRE